MNNNNTTTVSNVFIDEFMPLANGEFTKIYLYLLRCISNGKTNISIDCLADFFNQTEADIIANGLQATYRLTIEIESSSF